MSYNITTWRTRNVNLVLPRDFKFRRWVQDLPDRNADGDENIGKRWCQEHHDVTLLDLAAQAWMISLPNQEVSGVLASDRSLIVQQVQWTCDCSGILYHDILLPLFKEYQGNLSALVVWEGGDAVVDLSIKDGVVVEQPIS